MKWKRFLRPDWGKIVFFIVIFALLFFLPILPVIITIPTPAGVEGRFLILWTSFYEILFLPGYRAKHMIVPILIYCFISYLLSCFIVCIYDKVKKK